MNGMPMWYELMTPDPAAISPFYRAVLGWQIQDEGAAMPNGAEYREIVRAQGGHAGGVLTLTAQMAEHGAKPAWLTYFHVEDVDRAVARAKELGAPIFMPPWSLEGVGRMAMLADPQGAPFSLINPNPPARDPQAQSDVFDPQKAGHCRWNELNTRDAQSAWSFYAEILGFEPGMAMPMGDAGDYQFIELGGLSIGAVNPALPAGSEPHWLPIFGVTDIEAAKAAVQAHGGTIDIDLQEIPGGEFALNVRDPTGAALGLVGPNIETPT